MVIVDHHLACADEFIDDGGGDDIGDGGHDEKDGYAEGIKNDCYAENNATPVDQMAF